MADELKDLVRKGHINLAPPESSTTKGPAESLYEAWLAKGRRGLEE
jgi:hypothetical protein